LINGLQVVLAPHLQAVDQGPRYSDSAFRADRRVSAELRPLVAQPK
jgi:hypothetical protein